MPRTILVLNGYFSYIDNYNKLIFTFNDDETINKLHRHCLGAKRPFDANGFTVSLPKNMKVVPEDIKNKVGHVCILHVKLVPYNFVSKLENNFGERITGVQLILINIELK